MNEREGEEQPSKRDQADVFSPNFQNAGGVVAPGRENCPWCGFPLPSDAEACAYCKWTRKGTSVKRQAIIYSLFVLLMLIGFGLAIFYVGRFAP